MKRVFKVNGSDWYLGDTFKDAVETAMKETGLDRDDYDEDGEPMTFWQMLTTPYIWDLAGDHDVTTCFFLAWVFALFEGRTDTCFATNEY